MRQRKIIGLIAAWGLTSMQPAGAMTVDKFIVALGDMIALERLCPELEQNSLATFFDDQGIPRDLVEDDGPYRDDLHAAMERALQHRKSMSIKDSCEDAIRLYGPGGEIADGMFTGKLK